jgi:uncharacterized membrane protein required for colicin V production
MIHDRTAGLKRVRIVASIIGAVMFGVTGAQQFGAEAPEFLVPGVLFTAAIGFILLFAVLTIVIALIKLFRKGD